MKVLYDGSYFTETGAPSPTPMPDDRYDKDWEVRGLQDAWFARRDYRATLQMIDNLNKIMEDSGLIRWVKWHMESKGYIGSSELVPRIELSEGAMDKIEKVTKTMCWNLGSDKCVSFPYGIHPGRMITALYQLSAGSFSGGKEGGYIIIAMEEPYPLLLFFDLNPNLPDADGLLTGRVKSLYSGSMPDKWVRGLKKVKVGFNSINREGGVWCIAHNLQYGYYHVWEGGMDFINWRGQSPLEVKE